MGFVRKENKVLLLLDEQQKKCNNSVNALESAPGASHLMKTQPQSEKGQRQRGLSC